MSKVTGKLRVEYEEAEVQEIDIDGRAVFITAYGREDEDTPEGKAKQLVALTGSTHPLEFIERITSATIETLDALAGDKFSPAVLYARMFKEISKATAEKVGDDDSGKELMAILLGH